MKNGKLLDLYSDYLISAWGQTTATGLSSLLDGEVSHDQIQRFLASSGGGATYRPGMPALLFHFLQRQIGR